MTSLWKIRITLERVGEKYRASLLTYRNLPDAREEKVELFMANTRDAALDVAREAAKRLGLSKIEIDERVNTDDALSQRLPPRNGEADFAPRRLYIPVLHIDTNLINARQKLAAVNQLENWAADEVILLNMSGTAHAEAQADGNPLRTRKANEQIFTASAATHDELTQRIADALFPKGVQNQNQQNDVSILREATKYQAILVTADGGSKSQPGGILGNRDKLRNLLTILSPEEAVVLVQSKIRERDDLNTQIAQDLGIAPPEWTGND